MQHSAAASLECSDDVRLFKRLLEYTERLNSAQDLSSLARSAIQIIRGELDFESGVLFVIDPEERLLRSLDGSQAPLPLDAGVESGAAERGEAIDIPAVNAKRTPVGVLRLVNLARPLTREHRRFLSLLSAPLGLAIERAWFCRLLEERRRMDLEIRRLQDDLAQMEKLSLIGVLTSGLVHEVKNPLTILMAHSEMLKNETSLSPDLARRLAIIDFAAHRAMEVVNNFLNFSSRDDAARAPADVNEAILKTVELVAHDCRVHNIRVEKKLGDLPHLMVNIGQIQQVLLNLLKNAMDSIRDAKRPGTITVSSQFRSASNAARVEIKDDGPGVPAESRPRLFTPFFTTKPSGAGTGLGLSVCRRLIEMHGGRIGFEEGDAGGAIFWFEIPAAPQL